MGVRGAFGVLGVLGVRGSLAEARSFLVGLSAIAVVSVKLLVYSFTFEHRINLPSLAPLSSSPLSSSDDLRFLLAVGFASSSPPALGLGVFGLGVRGGLGTAVPSSTPSVLPLSRMGSSSFSKKRLNRLRLETIMSDEDLEVRSTPKTYIASPFATPSLPASFSKSRVPLTHFKASLSIMVLSSASTA